MDGVHAVPTAPERSREHQATAGLAPRSGPAVRLTGVDVARGVAVLGMYAVHVGPNPLDGGGAGWFKPFEGHSAALFAVLAGVSIALMSGGRRPKEGRARTRVALRLATRAPLLVALGLLLSGLGTGYMVILAYYGACFLLAIPWLRCRARTLAVAALVTAVVMPLVSFALRSVFAPRDLVFEAPDIAWGDFATWHGLGRAAGVLLLTGTFPAVTLMAYLFAGMAIGRLDLRSPVVARALCFGGAALALGAYGVSWLATRAFGGLEAVHRALEPAAASYGMSPETLLHLDESWIHGTPPTTTWAWELLPSGASCTPFDLLVSIGVAASVLGGCLLLPPFFERLLRPLADLGGRALSAYALHFVAIWLIWDSDGDRSDVFALTHFVAFSAVALIASVAWRRRIGRGPLEWAMARLSRWPDRVLP
ncbi:DUF418 domain-containing protein [Amycolatopsis sp. NPDC049252]|uniref:DUF418 domain-containing protein n=1 Tax=Amycolatopsis sp. NPDC049252 TaxID=3363933 RepID=UPI003717F912